MQFEADNTVAALLPGLTAALHDAAQAVEGDLRSLAEETPTG